MKSTTTAILTAAMLTFSAAAPHLASAAVTDADKTFLTMASQSDQNEIALSQLASEKGSDSKVKSYAQKMVSDHTMLSANMKPFADKWGVTPAMGPDADHQAELDKLKGLSGADFDKEYMTMMAADHHKALDAFKTEKSTTTDGKFKSVVSSGEKVVAEHTKMADKYNGMSGKMSGM